MGCISLGFFFLNPSQAASKSVASISATACFQLEACSIKLLRSWSLIWRSPPTPSCERNSWSIRALGTCSRWAKRAKARQARCSLSKVSTSLRRWAGVSTVNKCVRHNWAALKWRRGPRAGRTFHCSLIKPSGMNESTTPNNSAVPVIGNFDFMTLKTTPCKPLRLPKPGNNNFATQSHSYQSFTPKLVIPSNWVQLRPGWIGRIRRMERMGNVPSPDVSGAPLPCLPCSQLSKNKLTVPTIAHISACFNG